MKIKDKLRSQNKGSSIIEIALGSIIIVMLVFIFLDIGMLIQGARINDSLAREAARAAAMGLPGKLEEGKDRLVEIDQPPYVRANAVFENARAELHQPFELVEPIKITETINNPIPSKLFGGPINGNVTVETTILFRPKFVISFFNLRCITLVASRTYPYTCIVKGSTSKDSRIKTMSY